MSLEVWLRQQGIPRPDMEADEAEWCSKMIECADTIATLQRRVAELEKALTDAEGWLDGDCPVCVSDMVSIALAGDAP